METITTAATTAVTAAAISLVEADLEVDERGTAREEMLAGKEARLAGEGGGGGGGEVEEGKNGTAGVEVENG